MFEENIQLWITLTRAEGAKAEPSVDVSPQLIFIGLLLHSRLCGLFSQEELKAENLVTYW